MTKVTFQDHSLNYNENENQREMAIRAQLARRGYRLMHRRNGQYWVMLADPMTLDDIEAWTTPRKRFGR
jgi:hypothetical protein